MPGVMSFLSGLVGGGNIIKQVGDAIDQNVTSDKERLQIQAEITKAEMSFQLEEDKIDASLALGQQAINLKEAQNPNLFVAGWRPFIGWVCGFGLSYQFLVYPLLVWVNAWQMFAPKDPPSLEMNTLVTVLGAMLGMGGLRTLEKVKGVDSKGIKVSSSNKK